jgi:hypothetical protein
MGQTKKTKKNNLWNGYFKVVFKLDVLQKKNIVTSG